MKLYRHDRENYPCKQQFKNAIKLNFCIKIFFKLLIFYIVYLFIWIKFQRIQLLRMIQTIVLIENGRYPFGQILSTKRFVKVEDIRSYSSIEQLRKQKTKVQNFYSWNDKTSQTTVSQTQNFNFIKLLKIYQSDLNLHFIYQYIPYSLDHYIQNQLYGHIDVQKSHILEMNSKLFLKKVCYQLGTIVSFLIRRRIKVQLQYELLGMDLQQNLKFFVDPNYLILNQQNKDKKGVPKLYTSSKDVQTQLKKFYQIKKQEILSKIKRQFIKIKKKQQYVPNFIIQGNQLIFCKAQSQQESQSQSPCPSNFTQSSFTDRCESVNSGCKLNYQNSNIRKTHGNLFNKLKKTQSFNYNKQSNKKLQQNIIKLQALRQKSKVLNQGLKQSYLSNKNLVTIKKQQKQQDDFNFSNIATHSHVFNKKSVIPKEEESWRNSQIPSNLRKTHLPNGSNAKSPNRFCGNFQGKRSKSNRNHKSSFQFKPKAKENDWFNLNRSFDKSLQQDYQDKSFQQTKSIRIQLQQSRKNKQRKNSYKVKILTCQQMQVDGDNVEQFVFNAMNKNFGNKEGQEGQQFDKFSNQSEYSDSNKSKNSKHSKYSRGSKYSQHRFQNIFSDKLQGQRKDSQMNSKYSQSPVKQHIRQKQRQSSRQKNIFEKYYEQFNNQKQKPAKNQKLQQKIKLAKQKAESVLNKYMKTKKYSNKTSTSKHPL